MATLKLKFHQSLIIKKTQELINNDTKDILWAAKCRSGKSYITGGLILEMSKTIDKLNILIITPAPTETTSQFLDMFNNFRDFNKYTKISLTSEKLKKILDITTENNIIIASKQLLQNNIYKNKL